MDQDSDLDFAYKYPFSEEAKKIVAGLNINNISDEFLRSGTARVEEDLGESVAFAETNYGGLRLAYVLSYVYARLIVSALGAYFIGKFAEGEAKRVGQILIVESDSYIERLSKELGIELGIKRAGEEYIMPFDQYLKNMPKGDEFALIHQQLHEGKVYISKYVLANVLQEATRKKVMLGLPIKKSEIPKAVFDYAKKVRVPKVEVPEVSTSGRRYNWIELLLNTPIPDARHRIVNLVLAPYLVNVKGVSEEEAFAIIHDYIEKCKALNPNTKITDSYIKYQCSYSKKRGLKPLSLNRAKELLGSMIPIQV